jgi:hypothetical protein
MFPLTASALAYWKDAKQIFDVEPGQVNVMVGSSSADVKLKQVVSVIPD